LCAGVVVALLVGACAGNDAAPLTPSAVTVTVHDFAFGPRTITVKAGGTITWTNRDSFDHSVQIDGLGISGPKFGPQTPPATYKHRFNKPGTYPYMCGVHNSMTGTVIVTREEI
jgi:plastocyanin